MSICFWKTWQTNSYHPTFMLKCGGNECVLTKISHNFHCHFNAPTLCGGLQSHRWSQRVGGGRGKGRQWSRKREREGDSLELGKSVSHTVFLLPCSHANKHKHQTHQCVHKHTHTHVTQTHCHHILKPSKCGCQKGSTPDSLPQPSRRIQRTGTLIMKRVAATTKRIKILTKWQTYMTHSHSRHLHR